MTRETALALHIRNTSLIFAMTNFMRQLRDEIDQILLGAFGEDASIERKDRKRPNAYSLIAQLSRIARDVGDFYALRRHDSKFEKLSEQLLHYWKRDSSAKVVLFAYCQETPTYINGRFRP